jgi:hypothetical protein
MERLQIIGKVAIARRRHRQDVVHRHVAPIFFELRLQFA